MTLFRSRICSPVVAQLSTFLHTRCTFLPAWRRFSAPRPNTDDRQEKISAVAQHLKAPAAAHRESAQQGFACGHFIPTEFNHAPWGESVPRAHRALLLRRVSRNGQGFPPLLKWPLRRENPFGGTHGRLLGRDTLPNLRAARARRVRCCPMQLVPTDCQVRADLTEWHRAWGREPPLLVRLRQSYLQLRAGVVHSREHHV